MSEEIFGQGYRRLTPDQLGGSEYGGTDYLNNTLQPKGAEALSAGDLLRLGYTVGDTSDPLQQTELSLDDRRQMLGLKPAGVSRPTWLAGTGKKVPMAELMGADYPLPLSQFGEAMNNDDEPRTDR